jgi:aspartyl-tRNA(Asn)/glutamyl-tRNA(Gln) amidotransferase subunit A
MARPLTAELTWLSARELGDLLRSRAISPVELVQEFLDRIARHDPALHAYLTVVPEEALRSASAAEAAIARGEYRGPLHGIPIAAKDLFATRGVRTTAGSKILADWVPDYDATVIERLQAAGCILLGKLHMNEFAYGLTQTNPHYPTPVNPWASDRIPGASSSGSAVAVAAALCTAALGSDTGGSIRQPASFCGVVGLKPTYGRLSRFGMFPLSWSLDHAGILTRFVADAALLLGAIAGYDARDGTCSRQAVADYVAALEGTLRGKTLGLLTDYFATDLARDVREAMEQAISTFETLGAAVRTVQLPTVAKALSVYYAIVSAEALAVHQEWLATRPEDYGVDNRVRLLAGLPVLAVDYVQAQRTRALLRHEIDAVLKRVDALVCPTLPIGAPRFADQEVVLDGRSVEVRRTLSRFTRPFNLTGHPCISLPCGLTGEGLPIGLQVISRRFDEATVLQLAHQYEMAAGWTARRPPTPPVVTRSEP